MLAMSTPSPARGIGCRLLKAGRKASSTDTFKPARGCWPNRKIGVTMAPGQMAFTRTRCGASSTATDRVRPITPAFKAL